MKKMTVLAGLFLTFFFVSFMLSAADKAPAKELAKMPENVKSVIENKCMGCHNTDSKNDKAKEKLDFKTMEGLAKIKKIGTFNHIVEALEKNEMPPEKFLDRYPDKKLSEEEAKMIMDWAKKEASALMGQ
jgi:uncharacterized membrane protein